MRNEIKAGIFRLREIEAKVERLLASAEDAADEKRIDLLTLEIEALQGAIEILEKIE